MGKRTQPEPALLAEIDRYLAGLAKAEKRVCQALAEQAEATFRLVVKVDRGRIASLRLESNEGLDEPPDPENSP
jgi:hypothetical protein